MTWEKHEHDTNTQIAKSRKYKVWWSKRIEYFGCILCYQIKRSIQQGYESDVWIGNRLAKMAKQQVDDSFSKGETTFEMPFDIKNPKSIFNQG